jgi:hypothetical protein
MASTRIPASRFWDAYFLGQFETLLRSDRSCEGTIVIEKDNSGIPKFFAEREKFNFTIDLPDLGNYPYENDLRFSYVKIDLKVGTVINEIKNREYGFIDPPPYGKERMAELATESSQRFPVLSTPEAQPEDLSAAIEKHIKTHHSLASSQEINFLVWLLGEIRASDEAPAIMPIIERSKYLPTNKKSFHFEVVQSTFHSLWKLNAKSCVNRLIELLDLFNRNGRIQVATLLSRLLSQQKLLSQNLIGDCFSSFDFWSDLIKPYANYKKSEWARFDVYNIFWENRLLTTRLLTRNDLLLERLTNDEVPVVSQAAKRVQHRNSIPS